MASLPPVDLCCFAQFISKSHNRKHAGQKIDDDDRAYCRCVDRNFTLTLLAQFYRSVVAGWIEYLRIMRQIDGLARLLQKRSLQATYRSVTHLVE